MDDTIVSELIKRITALELRIGRTEVMETPTTTASGDVVGPGSSTDNAVARFDGVTGKLIQNSGVIIDDSNNVTIPGFLDVAQPTVGNEVMRLESVATNDDPRDSTYQGRIATTNATPSTTGSPSFTLPSNSAVMIEVFVRATRTGGASGAAGDSAFNITRGGYKNVAGTVTLVGALNVDYNATSTGTYLVTLVISGTSVLCQVTGAATTNITWHVTMTVRPLAT